MITVADHREEKHGGTDPRVIGVEPQNNGFTGLIPIPRKLPSPTEVAESVHDLLAQAALSSGVGVAPMGDPAPTSKMAVEIQTFWCTGFPPVLKADITASAMILGPDGAVRVPGAPLQVSEASVNCQLAFRKALDALYTSAQGWMQNPQVHNAATGAGGAPAAAPAAGG